MNFAGHMDHSNRAKHWSKKILAMVCVPCGWDFAAELYIASHLLGTVAKLLLTRSERPTTKLLGKLIFT